MRGSLQHDKNDCGLACILTICRFLKISVDEMTLRKKIFLGNDGLSLYGITETFRTLGVETLAVEGDDIELYALLSENKKPILVMINEDNESHYVVLYKKTSHHVFLWDPNIGKRVITKEDFSRIWSNYAVIITKISDSKSTITTKKSSCLNILFQQKKLLFLMIIFSVTLMAVTILTTFLYRNIIDQIQLGLSEFTPQLNTLFITMGISYLLLSILFIAKRMLIAYSKKELDISLQNKFLESLLNISIQKKEDYTSGGILDRYYRLSVVAETMISIFSSVILECISLIAGAIILIGINPVMFYIVLIIVAAYIISFIISKKKLFELSKTIMDKESLLITHIKETIENLISLKSFENTKYSKKMHNEIKFVSAQEYALNKLSIVLSEILGTIEHMVMLIILVFGIHSVITHNMSFGTLLAFESFVSFFLSPVRNLLGILPSLQETILTFHRIEDIFAYGEPEKINHAQNTVNGKISVENLDIAYGYDAPILRDLSFTINVGEKIFLVGSSGCGKSTLAKTLAGLIAYNKGDIIWGSNKKESFTNLSKQILYLSQEPEIFSGTIKENVLMWKENYDSLLFNEVIEIIGIRQMMDSRGLDLDSHLLENGTNLSGGEKQRIALARAIMHDVPIYIFDEATCHLDFGSECIIVDYIKKKLKSKTCIIISHNVKLLHNNDIILFIDSTGKLHQNHHLQLLQNNLEYKKVLNGEAWEYTT